MNRNIPKEIKESLKKINGIYGIKIFQGSYHGKDKKPASFEYHLKSEKFEDKSKEIYNKLSKIISTNHPNVSIDYTTPNVCNNPDGLRKITLKIKNKKPSEKQGLTKQIGLEFKEIIDNYLIRKH